MTNGQLRKALGLVTPVERLVVRNALKRVLAELREGGEKRQMESISCGDNLH